MARDATDFAIRQDLTTTVETFLTLGIAGILTAAFLPRSAKGTAGGKLIHNHTRSETSPVVMA